MSRGEPEKRKGYTTGTCAAAAAKAAAFMLLTGKEIDKIRLQWHPVKDQDVEVVFDVENPEFGPEFVRCAVRKDAGEDIDVTDGLLIYAKASRLPDVDEIPEAEMISFEHLVTDGTRASAEAVEKPDPDGETAETIGKEVPMDNVESLPLDEVDTVVSGTEEEGTELLRDTGTGSLPQDLHEEDILVTRTVSLLDLEDDNGIIPMRWDKVADFFKSGTKELVLEEKDANTSDQDRSRGGRFITLADDGTFSPSEWSLIQELFHAAEEPKAQRLTDSAKSMGLSEQERFSIQGGEGIGIVTKPGLDQPPGEAAINSGPRRMIREAVASVCDTLEYEGRLQIEISVPGGEDIAFRTFNPRLGIEGGISILGTTGIVEPMSGRAVVETVRAEVRVKAAASKFLALVPGNTGAAFVSQELLIPEEKTVIMSNYPGDALDEARASGVERVLLTGSLGKMIKLAGGIFYTHSKDADARMDILIRCAMQAGAPIRVLRGLDGCVTTEAGLTLLDRYGLLEQTVELILERAVNYTRHRAEGMQAEMILLRNSGEVLAFSDEAFSVMTEEENA